MDNRTMKRSAEIIRTSVIGVVVNVVLTIFKVIVGLMANSVAVMMDAVNNLSDAMSSVITIIGAMLSAHPADHEHPFGFGRVEYFSAIIIAVIVLSAGITSFIESVKKIVNPVEPDYSTMSIVIIVVAILFKLILGLYVKRQGRRLSSDALTASGSDALFDAVITFSTLVSAIVMLVWNVSLDGVLGALISLVIIKAGVEMLASPVNELLGARISQELVADIRNEVMTFDGVHGVFDVILHNYGPEVMIGSLHINVNDTMNAYDIHGLTRRISERMFDKFGIIMTVGIYAVATGHDKRSHLQDALTQYLSKRQDILQIHGFYYYEEDNRMSVDVVPALSVRDDIQFRAKLTGELKKEFPDVEVGVVIDHNYSD